MTGHTRGGEEDCGPPVPPRGDTDQCQPRALQSAPPGKLALVLDTRLIWMSVMRSILSSRRGPEMVMTSGRHDATAGAFAKIYDRHLHAGPVT